MYANCINHSEATKKKVKYLKIDETLSEICSLTVLNIKHLLLDKNNPNHGQPC